MSEPIPAATVVLLRDAPSGVGVETLMLRKTRGQSFGGMWVFPGGRLEPEDDTPAAAAVREAFEETGLVLRTDDLVPFAHWVPPPEAPKRFATWFFLAALPEGAADVVIDGGEIGDQMWAVPADALAQHAAGHVELAPPTWVTLHSLAEAVSPADALDRARREDVAFFSTRIYGHGEALMAVWAPDAAYESGDFGADGARHRLAMHRTGGWTYEVS